MKVGDLVCRVATRQYGIVERIDVDYHGAGQAFKAISQPREHCVDNTIVLDVGSQLSPTHHGKQDRVMVCWTDGHPEYLKGHELEVISSPCADHGG